MSGTDNQNNGTTPDAEISDALLEQATIWHARMHDTLQARASSSTETHLQEFSNWLDAAPNNRAAFTEVEYLWGALEKPVADILSQRPELISTPTIETVQKSKEMAIEPGTKLWKRMAPSSLRLGLVSAGLALVMGVMLTNITNWNGSEYDFETDVGERSPVVLADGSRVTLNTDSAMTFDMTPTERRVSLVRGEAWFDVSSADPRPFFVTTKHGLIRVTGTSFDVRVESDTAIVSLTEGQVELRAQTSEQLVTTNFSDTSEGGGSKELTILMPGEQASLSQGQVSQITHFDKTALTAWLRGQFVFYNTPLSEVVDTLNRYRSGHVLVLTANLADLKVSGVFSTNDPNKALDLIADTLPVQLTYLTDYLVLVR
ncbi:MAG: FecR family protein [Parvibaculaceae bacterium]|nr:FecR family protein [Parvibaculaceae bacterium]